MPKRINFANIHSDANVLCSGYEVIPLRTGYESVIPYRTRSGFAVAAKQNGEVVNVDGFNITVKYDDGLLESFPIGRKYGNSGGLTTPHSIGTELKKGDKFKSGDILTYNKGFFTKDPLNPSKIILKLAVLTTVAVVENNYTFEDSCLITKQLADKLTTYQTKIRNIRVRFDQEIHNLKKPGTQVTSDEILCLIEDKVTASGKLFDATSIAQLQALGSQAPKAKITGNLEKIEVYYYGKKENMTDSLRDLVNKTDKIMRETTKTPTTDGHTGEVGPNYLVDAEVIAENEAVIRFYISGEQSMGEGDKLMFSHQLKSTVGHVSDYIPTTFSGEPIDAYFGARSINARLVNSPYLVGTTNYLLVEIGKMAAKMLDEK